MQKTEIAMAIKEYYESANYTEGFGFWHFEYITGIRADWQYFLFLLKNFKKILSYKKQHLNN